MPASMTSIEGRAFQYCGNLTDIIIPDGVTYIGSWTFYGCGSLTNVTIPESVTNIYEKAFCACGNLDNITIPDSVEYIALGAFLDCRNLKDIYYTGSQAQWENIGGTGISELKGVTIHYNAKDPNKVDTTTEKIIFNGHTYQFILGDMSWTKAKEYCEAQGGHLLTITSEDEQKFITQLLYSVYGQANTRGGSWLGMRCSKTTATWITGEEVVYTNWNWLEPNGDALGYGIVNRDGRWNDGGEGWSDSKGFICEWDTKDPEDVNITAVDWSALEGVGLQSNFSIYVDFAHPLKECGSGNVQLWVEGEDEPIRTINADGNHTTGGWLSTDFDEENNQRLEIVVANSIAATWTKNADRLRAIPFEKKIYLTIDPDAVVFADENVSFAGIARNSDERFAFTTSWGLTADEDFLGFVNSTDDFGNPKHYAASSPVAQYMLKEKPNLLSQLMLTWDLFYGDWGGSCLGMASVVALAKCGWLDLKAWDSEATICYDLKAPKDSPKPFGTQDLINYYHLLQTSTTYPQHMAFFLNARYDGGIGSPTIATIIDKARNFQTSKEPLLIKLSFVGGEKKKDGTWKSKSHIHYCLAYAYSEDDETITIYLYDPSEPAGGDAKIRSRLEISKEDCAINFFGGWHNKEGVMGGSCRVTEIGYTLPEDLQRYNIDEMAKSFKKGLQRLAADNDESIAMSSTIEENHAIVFFDINSNCTITNEAGETLIYQDGQLDGTMAIADMYAYAYGDASSGGEYGVAVDKSRWFEYQSDGGETNFTLYQDGSYLGLRTENEKLTVKAIPNESLMVSSPDELNYQVVANYNDDNLVVIEGKSSEPVVAQYLSSGQIQLSADNLTDVQVSVIDTQGVTDDLSVDFTQKGLVVADGDAMDNEAVAVHGVTLDSDILTLSVGESAVLEAHIQPVNATDKRVRWSSDHTDVAKVDSSGRITAIGEGEAFVTVLTEDGSYEASCKIIVTPAIDNTGGSGAGDQSGDYYYDGDDSVKVSANDFDDSASPDEASFVKAQDGDVIERNFTMKDRFDDVRTDDWFYEAVGYVCANQIMNGTGEKTFSPYTAVTRGMVVSILHRLEKNPQVTTGVAFTDVSSDAYYAQAVAWAAANHIVNGYGNGQFAPDTPITREQLAAILYNYANYKGISTTAKADLAVFADAQKVSDYAKTAMQWANGMGLIRGVSETTLAPQGYATRAQVAAVLMRFCENVIK